ncbi:hypothetical protein [Arthrobacter sp. NEB 688]|uniref:hypothetical protein n=1 Tax=Arthrobacter sp. NEB 688 TaxID=904039 RepID=UPI00256FF765|nr:hypothetical protein [Arthrobacter sp. NEB 688]
MAGSEGLSLGYRIGWRVRYLLTSVFGPAQLGTEDDPQNRLRRERARRVEEARRSREG